MASIRTPSTYRVAIAFADGPLVVTPTWTDVTPWFRAISTNRGRSSELDDFQPGAATVVLDNRDRRFDSTHTTGPHYGLLLPRRQIKIETIIGVTTRPVFRGVISSWRQAWAHDDGQVATIDAVDIASVLAQIPLGATAHDTLMGFYAPSGWWPLDGDTLDDRSGRWPGVYDTREKADPIGALPGASRIAGGPAGGLPRLGAVPLTGAGSSTKTTIAALVQVANPGDASNNRVAHLTGSGGEIIMSITPAGVLRCDCLAGASGNAASTRSVGQSVRHIAVVRDGTSLTVYLDGVAVGSASTPGMTTALAPNLATIATIGSESSDLTVSNLAVWHGTALTADQLALLADAAHTARLATTASARVDTIADLAGIPAGLRDIAVSSTGLGATNGGDAWGAIQTSSRSVPAAAWISRDGKLTFRPTVSSPPAATFADAGAGIRYSGIEIEISDRWIRNEVTVTGPGGISATAVDSASAAAYGRSSLSITSELPTVGACRGLADLILDMHAQPTVRGSGWTVDTVTDTEFAAVCALEVGDIVTVTRTPPVGTATTSTVQITSIGHSVTADTATVAFGTAPFTAAPLALWDAGLWDTDTWG